jgi:iron complex outermembrane receptor protein
MNNKNPTSTVSTLLLLPVLMSYAFSVDARQAVPQHSAAKKSTNKSAVRATHAQPPSVTPTDTVAPKAKPNTAAEPTVMQEVLVTSQKESEDFYAEVIGPRTSFTSPAVRITRAQIQQTNAVTTQDSVKYESGVFVRQRYIGDPNSPIGMRGSNPYQGGRVMVFADGMPIWNPLQTSFNGSPRWGLIGPGEIKTVDVISGPFSAEYSGNAMGGVVNFTTLLPQKREVYTEATYML